MTVSYGLAGGAISTVWVNGSYGNVTLTGLTSGLWTVTAAAVDAAGHVDSSPPTVSMDIDVDPPSSAFAVALPPVVGNASVWVVVDPSENATVYARTVIAGGTSQWVPGSAAHAVLLEGIPDGLAVVQLRSVDAAGNVEPEPYAFAAITVDTVPPVLRWDPSPPPQFTNMLVTTACVEANDSTAVTFSSDVPAVLTPDGMMACVDVQVSVDGEASVAITATDAGGHVSMPLTASWVLDTSPPTGVIVSDIAASSRCVTTANTTVCPAVDAASVTLACDDGSPAVPVSRCRPQYTIVTVALASGSQCPPSGARRLADDVWVDALPGTPITLGPPADGEFTLAVRGVDEAGNIESGNTSLTWFVDSVAPSVGPVFRLAPDSIVSTDEAVFEVALVDDGSPGRTTLWYSLNGGPDTQILPPPVPNSAPVTFTLTGLSTQSYVLAVWGVDQADHTGQASSHSWRVVSTAPRVNITLAPVAVSTDPEPEFNFVAVWDDGHSERDAAIQVSLGEGFDTPCPNTNTTDGVCSWRAQLVTTGTVTLTVRTQLAGVFGDPATYTWEYKVCADTQFAVVDANLGIECQPCPPGANCDGGTTQLADLVAVAGFWAPPDSSRLRFYSCPVPEACLAGGVVPTGANTSELTLARCAEGYEGTLCAVCADGFFQQFGRCTPCNTSAGVAWMVTFLVVAVVAVLGALAFKFKALLPVDQLKVTLSMTQIIASANTAYEIPWPSAFSDFLDAMRVFLVDAVSLTRASCAQPMTFFASLVVTLVGFKVVLLVVVTVPVIVHKVKEYRRRKARQQSGATPSPQPRSASRARRRSSIAKSMMAAVHAAQAIDWAKIFQVTFLFLFVAYPGVSLKIMKTFKCVEVEGQFWLVADMRLKCYEGEWFGYALYAFVMGCLYTAGLPIAVIVILVRNRRRLDDADVRAKWGFLYETYGSHAYLWEAVELVRKLWLTALVVLMEAGTPLQVTVAVLISGWAHVLHALYKPWRGVGDVSGQSVYALQHGSLFVTFFVFLMGLLFKVDGVSQGSATYDAVSWVMVVVCALFLVFAVGVLVFAGRSQLRAAHARGVVSKTGNTSRRGTAMTANMWKGSGRDVHRGSVAVADVGNGQRSVVSPRQVRAKALQAAMSWVSNPISRAQPDTEKE